MAKAKVSLIDHSLPSLSTMPPFPWQSELWLSFIERIKLDKLPHAILLHGEAGIGVFEFSYALAQYASCFSPTDTLCCGKCKACQLMDAGSFPDLIWVALEEKATQIKVDQIRLVSDFVSKTSQYGGRKIIIIESAESMNLNAANALLKNLEEPSGDTLFILTSNVLGQILPTIRSRCFQVAAPYPSEEQSLTWLKTHVVDEAESLLSYARGAPLLALEWFSSDAIAQRKSVFSGMSNILMGQQTALALAQKWSQMDAVVVLESMQFALDECIKSRMSESKTSHILESLTRNLKTIKPSLLFRLRDKLLLKRGQLQANVNLNPTLFIEELVLDWAALCNIASRT